MDDGVIVLDAQRRLVDLNAAAERYTGCTPGSLGRPIDEVVAWWNEAIAEDRPLADGQPAIVKVEPGPRYFEVKVSAVRDSERRFVGWLVDRPRHFQPAPQRSRALRVRSARAGTAEERKPDGAGRRRRARLQQPADRHSRQCRSAGDPVAAGFRSEARRRVDRHRRAARRRPGVEDARLLGWRPRRRRARRSRRAGQGDGRSARRVGGAALHADLQQPRPAAAGRNRSDPDPAGRDEPDHQRRGSGRGCGRDHRRDRRRDARCGRRSRR